MKRKLLLGLPVISLLFGFLIMTSTVTAGNWWDGLGTPEYGGTLTYAGGIDPFWDVNDWRGTQIQLYVEPLFGYDWTVDRQTCSFKMSFIPIQYRTGVLAQSWEQSDPQTVIFHLRKGVHFQNKPPVNGRELTADDIKAHYDRLMGTGHGYTKPQPMFAGQLGALEGGSVTVTDKYTIQIKFGTPSAWGIYRLAYEWAMNSIEPPETVQPDKPLTDWKLVNGTGPWILSDYVSGSSITYSKNPDYWGTDPRYPQNKLPYLDTVKILSIPDQSTAIAALRTGKIDIQTNLSRIQAKSLSDTNPELQQTTIPAPGPSIGLRVDKAPFTDIRVRKALQMSLDLGAIAKGYYSGTVQPIPSGIINNANIGYCYPYNDWSQSLKDEYGYNPSGAKQLLADADFPNGFKTNIVASSVDPSMELLQIFKSYFNDIGIDMEIRTMDGAALMNTIAARKHDQMRWDGMGRTGANAAPDSAVSMHTTNMFANENNISDPAYDALFKKFMGSTDMDEANNLIIQMDKYGIEQHWDIVTFSTNTYYAYQPHLKGYSGEALMLNLGTMWSHLWISKK